MSGVQGWASLPFGDKDAWKVFLLQHALAHKAISDYLAAQNTPTDTLVFPDDAGGQKPWLLQNALAHQQNYDLLNLGSIPNLEEVDLTKQEEYYSWMLFHAQIHAQENLAAGL